MICEAFSLLMKQTTTSVLEPIEFKKSINTTLPLFFGNQQQDAAEFFNFMLDKMNEEMNRADKKKTILSTAIQTPVSITVV
jgi:ubiquitin C-terminal hydrolase